MGRDYLGVLVFLCQLPGARTRCIHNGGVCPQFQQPLHAAHVPRDTGYMQSGATVEFAFTMINFLARAGAAFQQNAYTCLAPSCGRRMERRPALAQCNRVCTGGQEHAHAVGPARLARNVQQCSAIGAGRRQPVARRQQGG